MAIVTKGVLVRPDAELLARLARGPGARVFVSIPFADAEVARALEPGAPTPDERLETVRQLAAAGVPTGIALAPLIPHLSEVGLPALVERAAAAGARYAFHVLLRLPAEVLDVFRARLEEALPLRAAAVFAALREMRGGRLQESRFGERMRGRGVRFGVLEDLLLLACRRNGLRVAGDEGLGAPEDPRPVQGSLFGDEPSPLGPHDGQALP